MVEEGGSVVVVEGGGGMRCRLKCYHAAILEKVVKSDANARGGGGDK